MNLYTRKDSMDPQLGITERHHSLLRDISGQIIQKNNSAEGFKFVIVTLQKVSEAGFELLIDPSSLSSMEMVFDVTSASLVGRLNFKL